MSTPAVPADDDPIIIAARKLAAELKAEGPATEAQVREVNAALRDWQAQARNKSA